MSTELRQWEDFDGSKHAHLRVEMDDGYRMELEVWEMILDAIWLIEAALRKQTKGRLSLPRTGLLIRDEE